MSTIHGPGQGHATTIHGLIREHAAVRPGAVALAHRGVHVTYGELDRLSDAYAARLHAAGVRQGDFVPVRLPRSVPLVTTLLGVLKLGAAYALMDGDWPAERVRDEIEQLGAALLVADAPMDGLAGVRLLSPPYGIDPGEPVAPPEVEVGEDDPHAVFFTSGTTGRPKGAASPHAGLTRLFAPGSDLGFGPHTVITQTAAQPWDLFSFELWGALVCGGTAVLIDDPYLTGPVLTRLVAEEGVNTVWATTSVFNLLVEESIGSFAGVGTVVVGGEKLSPRHVRAFLDAHPGTTLVNGYGPVEATVFTTTRVITPQDCDVPGGIPIGRPVPRTRVHVLDGDRVCADGELGELCVAGAGLAREYVGAPDLTALKFVTLPLDGGAERVYRTGDLGLRDEHGVLHYRGRLDRQVKVRGFRVEPAEVEAVLAGLPGVRACVVVPRLDAAGAAVGLLGFAVTDAGPEELRARMRDLVPHYQVPDRVVAVEAIPLMPNGKLDAAALLALAGRTAEREETAGEGDDEIAATVREVVASVVGCAARQVGDDVPFTVLGATSLDHGRMAARLGERLGRPVPLSRAFQHPTVAELAAWLRTEVPDVSAQDVAAGQVAAMSPMQTLMAMEHLFDPAGLDYHVVFAWRIEGRADREAVRAAFAHVHRRHEALRSRYRVADGPVVVPTSAPPPAVRESLVATEGDAVEKLGRELALPFDIGAGAVWRPVFVAVRERPVTLIALAAHHIAFDGGSAATVAADFSAAYRAHRAGTSLVVEPAPGVAQVAAARDAHLRHADTAAQRDHWRATLTALPRLTLPAPDSTVRTPDSTLPTPDSTVRTPAAAASPVPDRSESLHATPAGHPSTPATSPSAARPTHTSHPHPAATTHAADTGRAGGMGAAASVRKAGAPGATCESQVGPLTGADGAGRAGGVGTAGLGMEAGASGAAAAPSGEAQAGHLTGADAGRTADTGRADGVRTTGVGREAGVTGDGGRKGRGAGMVEVVLGPEVEAGVAGVAQACGVSPFVVYLAAHAQTVAELTGQDDFGIGTSFNRRGDTAVRDAVGCLIDILCLRPALSPALPADEAIKRTADVVARAFAAQDVTIYEAAELAGATAGPALFQTMFLLQDNAAARLDLDGLPSRFFRPPYPGVPGDVVAELWPGGGREATYVVGYRPGRVARSFCEDLAAGWSDRLARYSLTCRITR